MPFVNVNSVRLFYEVKGSGAPIIFISGFGADHLVWDFVSESVSQEFKVITFDNRGVGQSDSPDVSYGIETMAEDAVLLLDALNIENAHVVGHSMGTSIAMTLAAKYPEKINKLILCNGFVSMNARANYLFDVINQLIDEEVSAESLGQVFMPWGYSNETLADLESNKLLMEYFDLMQNNPYPQTHIGYCRQFAALKAFDATELLPQIQAPTLVIAGEDDILTPPKGAQYLAEHISNAKFHLFKKSGHMTHLEYPYKFVELVKLFLCE